MYKINPLTKVNKNIRHLKILNKVTFCILSIPLIFQIVSWGHNLLLFYGLPTHLQKLSEIQDWWMDFLILHTCVHMWFWQQNLAHILRFIQEVNNVLEKIKIIRCIVFCVTKHMFSGKLFHDLIIYMNNLKKRYSILKIIFYICIDLWFWFIIFWCNFYVTRMITEFNELALYDHKLCLLTGYFTLLLLPLG